MMQQCDEQDAPVCNECGSMMKRSEKKDAWLCPNCGMSAKIEVSSTNAAWVPSKATPTRHSTSVITRIVRFLNQNPLALAIIVGSIGAGLASGVDHLVGINFQEWGISRSAQTLHALIYMGCGGTVTYILFIRPNKQQQQGW